MADRWEGVSEAGIITTGADRGRVDAVYEELLSEAIGELETRDSDASLYLYGSVATGAAQPPSSDIDLLTIGLDPAEAAELADRLSDDYQHLCRAVDIAPMTDLDGDSDEAYGNRVFLRHYCVHLTGPPRHVGLPEFAADARAARGFNGDIAQHARRWRAALNTGADPVVVGRRAARKTLLAIAGLISITDGGWITDRRQATQRWSRLHPEWAGDVMLLTDWSGGGSTPTSTQVRRLLDGAIAAVVDRFSELIGLWGDTVGRRERKGV